VTYYLSPAGSDSAAGTSPQTAWRTLGRASSARLRPGDRLLLRGGARFTGQLEFARKDGNDPAKPVQIGSYGSGRATIAGLDGPAITIFDTSGFDIRNLVIVGNSTTEHGFPGVQVFSDLAAGRRLGHIVIDGVDVSGFSTGISIGARNPAAGFRDVWIRDCSVHDNIDAGLSFFGPSFDAAAPSYAHTDIHITRVKAYRNSGDPANTHRNTGNGIVLGSVSHASVTWSTASDNGGNGGARNEGPVGIWAYNSSDVVIEHNLSYGNRTASRRDGGGFGLDSNTSRSYLQYNLSYGNAGAGYQVYSPNHASNADNVVRFNISSGDGLVTLNAAGIIVAGRVRDASVYQNTVVMSAAAGDRHAALWLGGVHGVTVRNNIFMVEHAGPIVIAEPALPASAALLQGNDYVATGRGWSLRWGRDSYRTVRSWRKVTGQETVRGRPVGLTADPHMAGPVLGLTMSTATDPHRGAGFVLLGRSALLGAGLDLVRLFGIDPGSDDYSGRPVSRRHPNVGAQ
jgi:hypothetical protein